MSLQERAAKWLDDRVNLKALKAGLSSQWVPVHRYSAFNLLGGMTLVLLLFLVASGILLLLYYRPSVDEAHLSVATIMSDVPFGYVVRSVHVWSADLFVGCLIAHVLVALIQRSYRKPRELIWMTGAVLLVLSIGAALTGGLLPWSEQAYTSARVSTELAARVPLVGHFLKLFLRGGEEITATSLTRFFGFHVAILPGAITLLVALHLWLIARRGVSLPMSIEGSPVKMVAYYPHIALRDQARGVALALVVVSLAEWLPRELGSRADPFVSAPTDARPAWYFLWVFEIIRSLPPRIAGLDGDKVAVSVLMGALATFFALPLLDRKGSKVVFYLGWAAVVCLVGATIHGLR